LRRTLVIFARTPELSRVKTRLQPRLSAREALRLHEALVEDTVTLALNCRVARVTVAFSGEAPAGLVSESVTVDRQVGGDLGERLTEATRKAFASGADHVVVIGTDSPDLPPARLDEAFEELDGADVVLGPAADGGYYLIGLSGPHVGVFEAVDWGSERVLEQTRQRVLALGLRSRELEPWFDVDRPEDLERLALEIARRRRRLEVIPESTAHVLEQLGLL
jgi:uncharacterized protein